MKRIICLIVCIFIGASFAIAEVGPYERQYELALQEKKDLQDKLRSLSEESRPVNYMDSNGRNRHAYLSFVSCQRLEDRVENYQNDYDRAMAQGDQLRADTNARQMEELEAEGVACDEFLAEKSAVEESLRQADERILSLQVQATHEDIESIATELARYGVNTDVTNKPSTLEASEKMRDALRADLNQHIEAERIENVQEDLLLATKVEIDQKKREPSNRGLQLGAESNDISTLEGAKRSLEILNSAIAADDSQKLAASVVLHSVWNLSAG